MKEKVYTYLIASGLMVIILMVISVFSVVIINGLPYFWPKTIYSFEMTDNSSYLGEIHDKEINPRTNNYRYRVKIGNREHGGQDFIWLEEANIASILKSENALMIERLEWGNAYGFVNDANIFDLILKTKEYGSLRKKIYKFEKNKLANLFQHILKLEKSENTRKIEKAKQLREEYKQNEEKLAQMYEQVTAETITLTRVDNSTKELNFYEIVNITPVNKLTLAGKIKYFFSSVREFIFSEPRESNTEGGVFPALFGTVLLVFLMSIAVFPLGVIAAIYLHEYAKSGPIISLIRITIFNLAGVPSIVYGVFGLGFFIYTLGGSIDQIFFSQNLPSPTLGTGNILWASLTLAVLTLPVVIVASLEGLKSVPQIYREGAYGLGATKWEVIKDVVIPNAMPGMLTGLILAISRAAGEVAPLMITGVVKLALNLPLDSSFPFLHLNRKFMHLGFHIYDVGFQSPNVEASRAMVFNTTLLLLIVVFALNLIAIIIRNKLRKNLSRSGV